LDFFVYAEDGLTLWALTNDLSQILKQLDDRSNTSDCQIFYRPSFGRSGGPNSPEFGEFDFIILSRDSIYLGESKWEESSELSHRTIALEPRQALRHCVLREYIQNYMANPIVDWPTFLYSMEEIFRSKGIQKMAAKPNKSITTKNLESFLGIVRSHFRGVPKITDILLFIHRKGRHDLLERVEPKSFEKVYVEFSEETDFGRFTNLPQP